MLRQRSWLMPAFALALLACESTPEPAAPVGPKPEPAQRESDPDLDALETEARELSTALAKQLKAKLLAALEHPDGAAHAVEVCQVEAPALAEGLAKGGWTVGRTALRVRNPSNAPNAWQREGLEQLGKALAADPSQAVHEWRALETRGEDQEFRYMRAIPMGGLCLGCHGAAESIAPEVRAQLAQRYPQDEATGFAPGDLRGAFVVRKQL